MFMLLINVSEKNNRAEIKLVAIDESDLNLALSLKSNRIHAL